MKPGRDSNKSRGTKKPRKPYAKPVCLSEQIFETTALACGKRPGRGGACTAVPRLS
jgi:hypothetical protein